MRLVTINKEKLKAYTEDPEMLRKAKRPCVLVIHLRYRGKRYDFAVPLRSNINPSTPSNQFFPLPPRKTTKSGHRHGVHYIKMFPVKRKDLIIFHTENNDYATLIKSIIDRHEKEIIKECQCYLDAYEQGIHPSYSTNIDLLIKIMEAEK